MSEQRYGPWVVQAELGEGTFGRVYRAVSPDQPETDVVVRVFRSELPASTSEKIRKRLAMLKKLRHDRILPVIDHGIQDGDIWYAAEMALGSSLDQILSSGRKLTAADSLSLCMQIVPALSHAHRRGLIHGALKPSVVFWQPDRQLFRMAEFGFYDLMQTEPGMVMGQPVWITPEQATGKPLTKRSDYYLLGCVLYTLITGRPLFACTNGMEWISKHVSSLPERPIHLVPDLPEEIDSLIMRFLAKDPNQRLAGGSTILAELDTIWAKLERRGKVGPHPEPVNPLQKDGLRAAPLVITEADEKEEEAPERPRLEWLQKLLTVSDWPNPAKIAGLSFLLLLVIGILLLGIRKPQDDLTEALTNARRLLASENPGDWETAWRKYLEPHSHHIPAENAEEFLEARRRAEAGADLRRVLAADRSGLFRSEAERFYAEGIRLCQTGDYARARQIWEASVRLFGSRESDRVWVRLTQVALNRLTTVNPEKLALTQREQDTLKLVKLEIENLKQAGKTAEADELTRAAETLYRGSNQD